MQSEFEYWPRAIILVDLNAFFASVEQRDNPALRNKPIAVTNGDQGTCLITASYEARAYGVKTGMRIKDAQQLCPGLIPVTANPRRYAETSRRIMEALLAVSPDQEIFSVDECFLDVTRCQQLHGHPAKMGELAKKVVFSASGGLCCSVGVSGDKTTAKWAANLNKPDGLTVIAPWEAKERLRNIPVTELCGIGRGIGEFLAKYGVYLCGDMERLPIGILTQRFGNLGRRMWYMCQGADPEQLQLQVKDPKSMGHGKVMPPNTHDKNIIRSYLLHMCEKLAARLRRHHLQAQYFFIGLHSRELGWLGEKGRTLLPTNDGLAIANLGKEIIERTWCGLPVHKIQVTALDPQPEWRQADLFAGYDERRIQLHQAIDTINQRYGEFAVAPAPLLGRSTISNVIAHSWRPSGPRQTI